MTGSGVTREPWRFGDDFGGKMRDIIKFRYRMMPYLYTLAYQSTQTGIPMNIPTVFNFMEDTESHYQNDNDFMVGDYLLVAPVFYWNARDRWVYLPRGADWSYWHSDQKFTGGQWVNVAAPLGTLPIFVRDGAIIPMGPTMKYVNEFVPDYLDLNIWPAAQSEFTLYEDDGETFDYLGGEVAKTRIVSKLGGDGKVEVTINPREGSFNPGARSFFVIVHNVLCDMTVTHNGAAVPDDASFGATPSFHFDPAERTLTVKVRDTGAASAIVAQPAAACTTTEFKITAIEPEFGVDDGAEPITLRGTGFTGVTKVQLGGQDCTSLKVTSATKITCKTPAHTAGWVTVTASKADGMMATRDYGYRYTGDKVVNLGWCNLQWPPELTVKSGSATANLYGQVWSKKITEPAGAPSGITAQVGFGPKGTDPRSRYGWKWFDAAWNVQAGNNDEFVGTVTPTTAGTYSLAYRFSDDSGVNYLVCDYNPGTSDGFSTEKLGKLVVASKSSKTDDPGDPTICGGGADSGGCSSAGGASPTFLGLLLFLATLAWLTTRREQ